MNFYWRKSVRIKIHFVICFIEIFSFGKIFHLTFCFELRNEVRHPRPSHGRIPNFRYCEVAAENLAAMECFKRARVIKINPSLAQEPVRYFTLIHNKVLLTSTPSLGSSKNQDFLLIYRISVFSIRFSAFLQNGSEISTSKSIRMGGDAIGRRWTRNFDSTASVETNTRWFDGCSIGRC